MPIAKPLKSSVKSSNSCVMAEYPQRYTNINR